MSVDDSRMDAWREMQARNQANRPVAPDEPRLPLFGGGGGGTYGGMEPRLAVLEAHMEHVREELRKLSGVPADLATLKERSEHLPTKSDLQQLEGELTKKLQLYVGIVGGLVVICATIAKLI